VLLGEFGALAVTALLLGYALMRSVQEWRDEDPEAARDPRLAPALADFVLNRGRSSGAGFAATVHDLIARGHLRLVPGDPALLLRAAGGGPLLPWELVVLGLVETRQLPGTGVPPGALAGSGEEEAVLRRFGAEVARTARAAGLRRFSGRGRRAAAWLEQQREAPRDPKAVPGTRAFAQAIALGQVPVPEHGVALAPPAGSAWSSASGTWRLVPLLGPAGRVWFMANPPTRLRGVVVHREVDVPLRGRSNYRLGIHDGRRKEAVVFGCKRAFFDSVMLGTWLEVQLAPYTGALLSADVVRAGPAGGGSVLTAQVAPSATDVDPDPNPKPGARPVTVWSVPSAKKPLVTRSDLGRLTRRPVSALKPVRGPDSTTFRFRIGGAVAGEAEIVVYQGPAAAALRATDGPRVTVQGGEATVFGPTRVVLVTISGLDVVTRRGIARQLAGLLNQRLWSPGPGRG
jgi:hypothetical protein